MYLRNLDVHCMHLLGYLFVALKSHITFLSLKLSAWITNQYSFSQHSFYIHIYNQNHFICIPFIAVHVGTNILLQFI